MSIKKGILTRTEYVAARLEMAKLKWSATANLFRGYAELRE